MAKPKSGTAIDSPFTSPHGPAPTPSSGGPGKYNEGTQVKMKGVDGGIPLKFYDESIKTPTTLPPPSMNPEPAKLTKS